MPNKKINFHKASWLDCLFLFKLRNMPETYKYFRNSYPTGFFEHLKWFNKLMSNSDKKLFVITVNGKNAGQIRFDKRNDSADISISVLKEFMGQHIMSSVFLDVIGEFLNNNKKIKKLTAQIKKMNKASINFFKKFGFKKFKEDKNGWGFYSRQVK